MPRRCIGSWSLQMSWSEVQAERLRVPKFDATEFARGAPPATFGQCVGHLPRRAQRDSEENKVLDLHSLLEFPMYGLRGDWRERDPPGRSGG
eukprot:3160497-Pyramimonas_sp.AAC.1